MEAPFLYTRADGFTESRDGDLAVVMRVKTGVFVDVDPDTGNGRNMAYFQFRVRFGTAPIRIEWPDEQRVILLNPEIVPALLAARYARLPLQAELDAFTSSNLPDAASDAEVSPAVNVADISADAHSASQTSADASDAAFVAPAVENAPADVSAPVLPVPAQNTLAQTDATTQSADADASLSKQTDDAAPQAAPELAPPPVASASPVVKAPPARKTK